MYISWHSPVQNPRGFFQHGDKSPTSLPHLEGPSPSGPRPLSALPESPCGHSATRGHAALGVPCPPGLVRASLPTSRSPGAPAACRLLPCSLAPVSIVCLSRKNVQLPVGGGLCVHPVSAAPGTQCVLNEHVNEWGSPSESCRVTNEPLSPAAPVPRFGYGD